MKELIITTKKKMVEQVNKLFSVEAPNAVTAFVNDYEFLSNDYECKIPVAEDNLVFKRLSRDGEAEYTINKNDYFSLKSGDNRRLVNLVSATELGDNLTATLKG